MVNLFIFLFIIMNNTSFLDYLMLLKQVKNVPPDVKAEEIKKSRIHIPDATIRNSFNKREEKTKRHHEITDDDDDEDEYTGEAIGYTNQAKKWYQDTEKISKQWSVKGTVGYSPPPFNPGTTEEIFI